MAGYLGGGEEATLPRPAPPFGVGPEGGRREGSAPEAVRSSRLCEGASLRTGQWPVFAAGVNDPGLLVPLPERSPFSTSENSKFLPGPWRVAPRSEQGCAEDRWGARVGCRRESRRGSPGVSSYLDFPTVRLPPRAALDVQKEAGHHDPNT